MGKTIEQLENDYWSEPDFQSSLVLAVHRLRRKPIDSFTTEDFRRLISQNIALEHLMPKALEIVMADPYAGGDCYEGDLLVSMVSADRDFFLVNLKMANKIAAISDGVLESDSFAGPSHIGDRGRLKRFVQEFA